MKIEKASDPISTLYIGLANIKAISDLIYNVTTVGDIAALNKDTIMDAMSTIEIIADECSEAVGQAEGSINSLRTPQKETSNHTQPH